VLIYINARMRTDIIFQYQVKHNLKRTTFYFVLQ